jgi:phasin family protein
MSTTDETKPAGKSKRRKGKGGKKTISQAVLPETPAPAELRSPDQERQPQPVHVESPKVVDMPPAAVEEPVVAAAAPPEPEPVVASPPSAPVSAPSAAEPKPVEPVSVTAASSPVEHGPVSLQALANAYRDYTRRSIEEFGSFVEQLSGARSLDKAMTVQTEFVKRAYETSVAESHKIYELHNRLAKQTLDPFKGLTGKTPASHGKP